MEDVKIAGDMSSSNRPRFDMDAVQQHAGPKVFARGEAYHRDGLVTLRVIDAQHVLAEVAGTENYRTELTGYGAAIGGTCSCRAFEESGFCKHMVAVALAANAVGDEAMVEGTAVLARIRQSLKQKGVDALVEMIVDLAERDNALFRRLELASSTVDDDGKALGARLSKAIVAATRVRHNLDYRAVPAWARGVETVLDALAELAAGAQAPLILDLAERAIERIEEAIEKIDDSDGYCGGLLDRACKIHLAAAQAAKPDATMFARKLFAREMVDGYGAFARAGDIYAEVLGEPGVKEYRRLATEAWEKLPARQGGRATPDAPYEYQRLRDILDNFAEWDGDVAARIALRTKDLSSTWRYLELAGFCLSQGQDEDALRWAEDGLFVFDDAWSAVRTHGASSISREALARASEATHPREALEVYAERVVVLANVGGNPAYAEAAALVVRMAGLRNASEQAAYLADIKVRFARRRSFIALLG